MVTSNIVRQKKIEKDGGELIMSMTQKDIGLEFLRLYLDLYNNNSKRFTEMFNNYIKNEYPEKYIKGVRFSRDECKTILLELQAKLKSLGDDYHEDID